MPSAGVSTMRCLVVDDHPVVRQGIRALLERELDGVDVATAATPEAALQESDGERPDHWSRLDVGTGSRGPYLDRQRAVRSSRTAPLYYLWA